MPDFDLLIRQPERDIGIVEGRIAELGQNIRGNAAEEIDATGLTILPGAIDSHVHFNEPGRTEWEGWDTGSRACALGGTTTVFEMPLNAHPPTVDGQAFDVKRAAAEKNSVVDFGLWGGLVPGNLGELETLRNRGVVGLKAFMCNSGIDDFPYADDKTLREGMRIAAELDLLVAVHAESQEITERLTKGKIAAGQTTIRDFLESRPVEAELQAIRQAIEIASATGCRLHIVHVSCGRGVELVAQARAAGVDVTCETCPHYLILSENDMEKIGAIAKCAPPLRSAADQSGLHKMLSQVTTIGSDHSPAPPEMKRSANFFEVWGGISGCQSLLPVLVDQGLTPEMISQLTSNNVAERFRIADKAGVAAGKDADLTLIDENAREEVTGRSLHYRHKQSPYIGRRLPRVIRTILRGQTIAADGKLPGQPTGRLVRPVEA